MYTLTTNDFKTVEKISLNRENLSLAPLSGGVSLTISATPASGEEGTYRASAAASKLGSQSTSNSPSPAGGFWDDLWYNGRPSTRSVYQQRQYVTFRWKNRCDDEDEPVTHEVAYRRKGTKVFTTHTTSRTTLRVKLSKDGKYEWKVRTIVGYYRNFVSDWSWGSFTFNGMPPKVSFYTMTRKAVSGNRTRVGIRWKANEYSTYVLYLDGKRVYKGKGLKVSRRYFTLKNGAHKYTLVARDRYGNKSYKRGTFYTDSTLKTPSAPTALGYQFSNYGKTIKLSWTGMPHTKGMTYYVRVTSGDIDNTYTVTGESLTVNLSHSGYWKWSVRAENAAGRKSSWVQGRVFWNDSVADVTAPKAPTGLKYQLRNVGGRYVVTFTWNKASDNKTTNVLYDLQVKVNGIYKTFSCPSTGYSLNLTESSKKEWRVRAVDGSGNVSNWTYGASFTNQYYTPSVISSPAKAKTSATLSLDKELAVSANPAAQMTSSQLSYSANDACSTLLESSESLEKKSQGLLATAV